MFIRQFDLHEKDDKQSESERDLDVLIKPGLQLHENFIRFIASMERDKQM